MPAITTTRRRSAAPATVTLDPFYYGASATSDRALTVETTAGERILASDSITLNGRVFHTNSRDLCACEGCGARVLADDINRVVVDSHGSTSSRCDSCASNTWTCFNCNGTVADAVHQSFNEDEDPDHVEPLCPACRPRESQGIWGRMLNYSNKDISKVKPKDTSSILYGWEVEVHVRNEGSVDDVIQEMYRKLGKGYYITKPDGSVVNGFEIVTRPDSMNVHREEWLRIFETIESSELLKGSLRSNAVPRACCGIHCHIDKSMLSTVQLGKLAVWLNSPENRSFIERVAGRGSNSYTSFRDEVKISDGRRMKSGPSGSERYVAFNVQRETAEMRIFRGTLNPKLFFKNLDFVEASVEWTGIANCSLLDIKKVGAFAAYVFANSSRWPFLTHFLREWKIQPVKSVK